MRTYTCLCGNRLFFDNTRCLNCGRELGWCPVCRTIAPLLPRDGWHLTCGNPACGAPLVKCHNYAVENVCNRCLLDGPAQAGILCDCCRFNRTIPDLSIPGNREKWYRLEAAKRRLFFGLDLLGLPYGDESDGFSPPLAFDFKADVIPAEGRWNSTEQDGEQVYTGHADGKITINVREADDAEREKLRVDFGEAHRTLIGHFRHEIGHYYWDVLVRGRREDESRAVFGDHGDPPYAEALRRHYESGPPPDWTSRYVSAYATMHPWEDFAETFATYLDLVGVLDTAAHHGLLKGTTLDDFDRMVADYQWLGMALNEMNRAMGLIDFMPEVFVPAVVEKLRFVHRLVREAGQARTPAPQELVA